MTEAAEEARTEARTEVSTETTTEAVALTRDSISYLTDYLVK